MIGWWGCAENFVECPACQREGGGRGEELYLVEKLVDKI